jgi:hypothetical protein
METISMTKPIKPLSASLFVIELTIFAFQVLTIFIVAFFISDMFASEQKFNGFISGKINATTVKEFLLTLFSVTFCLGLVTIAKELAPNKFISRIATEILDEIPRTIYLLGSNVTAVTLAIAVYLPQKSSASIPVAGGLYIVSILFAVTFFIYGFGIKVLLVRRRNKLGSRQALFREEGGNI